MIVDPRFSHWAWTYAPPQAVGGLVLTISDGVSQTVAVEFPSASEAIAWMDRIRVDLHMIGRPGRRNMDVADDGGH